MPNFMDLPTEIRLTVYEYLLTEEVQPTARRYPRDLAICEASESSSVSKLIRDEAYPVYLSSNNIVFDNSRTACLWLGRISPYISTQAQALHITFDLRHDENRSVGKRNTRKADQKRLFRLLAAHTKLHLTLKAGGHLVENLMRCGALDLMHGFASASSTSAPAANSRCHAHGDFHQFSHHQSHRKAAAEGVTVAKRRITAIQPLLRFFTTPCPAGCEHLAEGGWSSESTIHLDVRGVVCGGLKCDATNCLVCFAKGI